MFANFLLKIFFVFYIFLISSLYCYPYRKINVIQKSIGITVLNPDEFETTTTKISPVDEKVNLQTESPENETQQKNATKMIENVLNTVVQSSMNDMLLKLTNSLGDLFSMFTTVKSGASAKAYGEPQDDEMVVKSHNRPDNGQVGPSNSGHSVVTYEKEQRESIENVQRVVRVHGKSLYSEKNDKNVAVGSLEGNVFENNNLKNKTWWRNILMKILKPTKPSAEENANSYTKTTLQPITSTMLPNLSKSLTKNSSLVMVVNNGNLPITDNHKRNNITNIVHLPVYENHNYTEEEFHISELPEDVINFTSTTTSGIEKLPPAKVSPVVLLNHVSSTLTPPTFSTIKNTTNYSVKNDVTSSAPMWELLIRLDTGLEGRLKKNISTVNYPINDSQVRSQKIASAKSILITGNPDYPTTTETVTPLPNRPFWNKPNNLLFQTVLISGAAVFAIFIFSCFAIALVCYKNKRKRGYLGRKFEGVNRCGLPRIMDAVTEVGKRPNFGTAAARRPVFKTSASSPYYYDSAASRSDWSLVSRDRDRQVETYFASASSVMNTCDDSSSPSSSGQNDNATSAILH